MTSNVVKRPFMLPVLGTTGNSHDDADSIRLRSEPKRRRIPDKTQSLLLPSLAGCQTPTSSTSRASLPPDFLETIQPQATGALQSPHSANADRLSTCSSSSGCSSASSSSSSSADCEPPSLIIPYLYVGNQAQTQIDTISSLDISYVLSLQSLPKFLDKNEEEQAEKCPPSEEPVSSTCCHEQPLAAESSGKKEEPIDVVDIIANTNNDPNTSSQSPATTNKDARGILPLVNSSKDYLVKVSSSVNRLIKGKCINISDTFEQLVDKFFDETHNFIEEARRNRCNVLIHCKAGISRSPTIAIAYLMKWRRLHLHDAYNFVKKCRPQISPNLNFMGQLVHYERQLLQSAIKSQHLPSPTSSCLPCPGKQYHQGHSDDDRTHHHHRRRHKHAHDRITRPSSLFLPATSSSTSS